VERIEDLSPSVRAFHLLPIGGGPLSYRPGQRVSLQIPRDRKGAIRVYSIASSARERAHFELCVKHVAGGPGIDYLWGLQVGDSVDFSGPHGKFVLREPVDRDAVFIATGTGIAPFRPMLRQALQAARQRRLVLLAGARAEEDLLYRKEWEEMERIHPNFRYIPTLSRPLEGWKGRTGYVQKITSELLKGRAETDVYICGQRYMVAAVREQCALWGIPAERVHFENYV
jgi:ferredoxin-NADP reductase